jgi:hypothetical protein
MVIELLGKSLEDLFDKAQPLTIQSRLAKVPSCGTPGKQCNRVSSPIGNPDPTRAPWARTYCHFRVDSNHGKGSATWNRVTTTGKSRFAVARSQGSALPKMTVAHVEKSLPNSQLKQKTIIS